MGTPVLGVTDAGRVSQLPHAFKAVERPPWIWRSGCRAQGTRHPRSKWGSSAGASPSPSAPPHSCLRLQSSSGSRDVTPALITRLRAIALEFLSVPFKFDFYFILKESGVSVLSLFSVYNNLIRLHMYLILCFRFFSHLGCYRVLCRVWFVI